MYDPKAKLQKIVISGPASGYAVGPAGESIFQLLDQGVFSDGTVRLLESRGSQQIPDNIAWTSSDKSIAIVTSGNSLTSGYVYGLRPGTVTITVTDGSMSGSVCFTVTPAVVQGLAITAPQLDAGRSPVVGKPGDSVAFQCTETLTDSTTKDVTQSILWTSSVASVATISVSGTASALVAGTTVIGAALPPSIALAKGATGKTWLTFDVIGAGGGLSLGASCPGAMASCAPGLSCCLVGRGSPSTCIPTPCPPPTP
jgi:hypothetical protein